jgi:tetratricopeptide (TPR) repeat protein
MFDDIALELIDGESGKEFRITLYPDDYEQGLLYAKLFKANITAFSIPHLGLVFPSILKSCPGQLRFECSFMDNNPGCAWEIYLSGDQVQAFEAANASPLDVALRIADRANHERGETVQRQKRVRFDWLGMSGLIDFLRAQNLPPQARSELLAGMTGPVAKRAEGEDCRSGDHLQVGIYHRERGDAGAALREYSEEIRFSLHRGGWQNQYVACAVNNYAVLKKREGKFDEALQMFKCALAINPNYYEALISAHGIVDDLDACLRLMRRIFAIRPGNELNQAILNTLAERFGLFPESAMASCLGLPPADLSAPSADMAIDDPASILDSRFGP